MIEIKDIEERIEARGIKKTWLMQQLDISRRTFYNRMKDKEFKIEEVSKLKQLGVI